MLGIKSPWYLYSFGNIKKNDVTLIFRTIASNILEITSTATIYTYDEKALDIHLKMFKGVHSFQSSFREYWSKTNNRPGESHLILSITL